MPEPGVFHVKGQRIAHVDIRPERGELLQAALQDRRVQLALQLLRGLSDQSRAGHLAPIANAYRQRLGFIVKLPRRR